MSNELIIVIAVIAIVLDILIYLIYRAVKKNKQHSIKKLMFFNRLYLFIVKIPVVGNELAQLKKDLYDNNLWEENISRYKAVLYYLVSWAVAVVLFIISCFYFTGNISIIAVLGIFCYYIKVLMLDFLLGDDTKLLACLIEFIRDLKQNNSLYGDIEEVIEAAIRESNSYLMIAHAKRLLGAIETQESMELYMEECPNEYLKLIALNSFETKEYGDKKDGDGISVFITNLNHINQNIDTELSKRRQLKIWLRGLNLLAVSALIWFTPLEWWMHKFLPQSDFFYQGSSALLIKFSIIISTIIVFRIIRSYQKNRVKRVYAKNRYWEEMVINFKPVQKIIDFIKPRFGSKRYFRYKNLIAKSGSYLKVEWLCLHRLIVSVLVFIISLAFITSMHDLNYKNILKNNYKTYSKDYIVKDGKQIDTTNIETVIINGGVQNDNKIINQLESYGITDKQNLLYLTQKIKEKSIELKRQHIKIYEILMILILSILSSEIPMQYLRFQIKLRRYSMENEIFIFETIILILMNYENSSVELMLENLKNFSTIFYYPLQKTMNNLQKGSKEALNELIEEVSYKPFTIIIKNLMKAEDIKASEAFEDLNFSRKSFNQQRRDDNRKIISERKNRAGVLALVPLFSLVMFYLLLPMLMTANVELANAAKLLTQ